MNDIETPHVGRHRDESDASLALFAIREYRHRWFGTDYRPKHNAAHRPAAVVSHLVLALNAEGAA